MKGLGFGKTLSFCALIMTVGASCFDGQTIGNLPNASKVQLINCNQVTETLQGGRSYNIFARKDGGPWIPYYGLNPVGPWDKPESECITDAAHLAASVTVDLSSTQGPGEWEIWAIKLPTSNEPDCNSSEPSPAPGSDPPACKHLTFNYQWNITAGTVQVPVSETPAP